MGVNAKNHWLVYGSIHHVGNDVTSVALIARGIFENS